MAGEQLQQASVGLHGVDADRVVHVRSGQGRLVTARNYPGLLGHHARLDSQDTQVLVDGRPRNQPSVLADVRKIVGPSAELIRDGGQDWFEIAAFGRDGRQLRPNLMIGGVEGLEERNWPGHWLRIGKVVIRLDSLRGRCIILRNGSCTTQ